MCKCCTLAPRLCAVAAILSLGVATDDAKCIPCCCNLSAESARAGVKA